MYIFLDFANNIFMENVFVISSIITFFLLIFPIFVSIDVYATSSQNKIGFSLNAFGFLKLFGGYITIEKDALAVHISDKKAICIFYKQAMSNQTMLSITSGFQIYALKINVELGMEEYPTLALMGANFLQVVSAIAFPVLKERYPFVNLKNTVLLSPHKKGGAVAIHFVTVFNQIAVILAISKLILKEIIEYVKQRRSKKT